MDKLKQAFENIPWARGSRRTALTELARSIVPVGNQTGVPTGDLRLSISTKDDDFEAWIMEIQGTAFQVGRGKLLTCWHVCEALRIEEREAYLHAATTIGGKPAKRRYPIAMSINFFDPRFDRTNTSVDVGMILCPAVSTPEAPYNVPAVRWGDSTKLGVGDRIIIGGFPLGRELFLSTNTNRGVVQPTFYEGIISAVIPAMQEGETRLLQLSSIALGGISGGVVCDPSNGRVLGMVTSGLTDNGVPLPVTYAIPSEVLQPWADAISFDTDRGERWR